jgi:hypothetical protein
MNWNNCVKFFCVLSIVLFSTGTIGQNSAPDNEVTEYDVAGFDTNSYHPVFIQSPDGLFKLNIGFYTQIRYNMNWRTGVPDTVQDFTRGYNMARTRIFFEGDLTKKFYYHFRVNINPAGQWELFVAYLQWNFAKKWNIRMGKQFMALGREDWMYAQDLAAIEFSAHDFTYAIWTSFGAQIRHVPSDHFRYWFGIGNGAYGSRRNFPQPFDSDIALTTRLEWNIFGSPWINWDDMTSRPGQSLGMLLGLGLANQQRFDSEAIKTQPNQGSQMNVDYSFAGNKFHFFAHASATYLQYKEGAGQDYTSNGYYMTLGYWVSNYLFPYVRYDVVSAGDRPGNWEDYASPGAGISFYPFKWTRRTRFTLEYNYLDATLNNTPVEPDGQLGIIESDYGPQQSLRFQLQFGF